jgi:hypothetical protein
MALRLGWRGIDDWHGRSSAGCDTAAWGILTLATDAAEFLLLVPTRTTYLDVLLSLNSSIVRMPSSLDDP